MATNVSKIGPWVSIACAIHCLAGPIVLALVPMIQSKSELIENVLIAFSIGIGILSIASGFREHRKMVVMGMLVVAVALLVASRFSEPFEEPGVISGALIMAGAQLLNLRYIRRCCAHDHARRSELSSAASRV